MSGPELIDIARDGLMTYARAAGPLMVIILVVGVFISFLQAVTQIQEQTLTFVPKMALAGLSLFFMLPFIGDALSGYMARLAEKIAHGG
jgi:flagellar biosynthesis protein FliQ